MIDDLKYAAGDCPASLANLRRELILNGWDRKTPVRVILELSLHLSLALVGAWLFAGQRDSLYKMLGLFLCTAGSLGVATNTHTSSHYATSERRWVNEFLTFLGYPLFLGFAATYWWHKHIVVHHPAPNVIGVDSDADLLPCFARTQEEVQRSSGLRRRYYLHLQWLAFPFALALNGFNMQRAGWVYLVSVLTDRHRRKTRHYLDFCAMLLHYILWLGIPIHFWGPIAPLVFYVLRIGAMGYALFAVLAPGHFPREAVCLASEDAAADFVLVQTAASVNFRPGRVGALFCSGLQYQIEHHLFPNISHPHYARLSRRVRQFCSEHGLPYRTYRWDVALLESWLTLKTPPPGKNISARWRTGGFSARPDFHDPS
jgi:linoleoyl-CoA desaturase